MFVEGLTTLEKKYFFRAIEDSTGASDRNIRLWIAGSATPTGFRQRKIDEIAVAIGKDPVYNTSIELAEETEQILKVQLASFSHYDAQSMPMAETEETNQQLDSNPTKL